MNEFKQMVEEDRHNNYIPLNKSNSDNMKKSDLFFRFISIKLLTNSAAVFPLYIENGVGLIQMFDEANGK